MAFKYWSPGHLRASVSSLPVRSDVPDYLFWVSAECQAVGIVKTTPHAEKLKLTGFRFGNLWSRLRRTVRAQGQSLPKGRPGDKPRWQMTRNLEILTWGAFHSRLLVDSCDVIESQRNIPFSIFTLQRHFRTIGHGCHLYFLVVV